VQREGEQERDYRKILLVETDLLGDSGVEYIKRSVSRYIT
jgi:hypothetical protein